MFPRIHKLRTHLNLDPSLTQCCGSGPGAKLSGSATLVLPLSGSVLT